jgi:hypothetical protein
MHKRYEFLIVGTTSSLTMHPTTDPLAHFKRKESRTISLKGISEAIAFRILLKAMKRRHRLGVHPHRPTPYHASDMQRQRQNVDALTHHAAPSSSDTGIMYLDIPCLLQTLCTGT